MINENDRHILFDTLELPPYSTLQRTLELLEIEQEWVFVCVRDNFRPLVFDVMRVHNLEVTFDNGARLMYIAKEKLDFKKLAETNKLPEGFYFSSLNQSHVPKINSAWAQKSATSEKFLSNCIEQNPSTGIFSRETGELIAWCLMLETGCMGHLKVDKKYEGKNFGSIAYFAQIVKMVKDLNLDPIGYTVHQNSRSFSLGTTKWFQQWIANYTFVGVRRKDPSRQVPLWGRL